jgi:hypothetical protein
MQPLRTETPVGPTIQEPSATLIPRLLEAVPDDLDIRLYKTVIEHDPRTKPFLEELIAAGQRLVGERPGVGFAPLPFSLAILEQETQLYYAFTPAGRLTNSVKAIQQYLISNRGAVGSAQAIESTFAQFSNNPATKMVRSQASDRAWNLYNMRREYAALEGQILKELDERTDPKTGHQIPVNPALLKKWKLLGSQQAAIRVQMEASFTQYEQQLARAVVGNDLAELEGKEQRLVPKHMAEFVMRYTQHLGFETLWNPLQMAAIYFSGTPELASFNWWYAVSVQNRMLHFVDVMNGGLKVYDAKR